MSAFDRPAAEFQGQARAARARLLGAATMSTPLMRAIAEDVRADFARRNHGPRAETLIEIERTWRALPAAERIALEIKRDRKALLIVDVRVTASSITHLPDVGSVDEPAICVVANTFTIGQHRAEHSSEAIATASHHALSRWFARAFATNDAALIADLRAIVVAAPGLMNQHGDFRVQTTNGGHWRGMVADLRDVTGKVFPAVLHVRTFV